MPPPAERSLRSAVGGKASEASRGGWCPPTAGMPEACRHHNGCLKVGLPKAVPNNQLLVRCVSDRLVIQHSGLNDASLRVPLLGTTPSQPPPLVVEEQIPIPEGSWE